MASKDFEHPALFKFGTLVSMEELTDGQNIAGQQSQTTSLRKDIYKAEINACYVGRSSFFAHFCVNASSKRKADGTLSLKVYAPPLAVGSAQAVHLRRPLHAHSTITSTTS